MPEKKMTKEEYIKWRMEAYKCSYQQALNAWEWWDTPRPELDYEEVIQNMTEELYN